MENTGYIKDLDCTKDTPVIYGHEDAPIYGQGIRIKPRVPGRQDSEHMKKIYLEELLPLEEYDMIAVLLSGGKDSIACYYKLIELGVPKEKIELWHHDIDGGHPSRRMDWRCTQNYVKAFAEAEQVPLRLSWRVNGFFGELYRIGASEPVEWMDPDTGEICRCKLSRKYIPDRESRESEIERTITEALLVHPATEYVRDFEFTHEGDETYCSFTVKGYPWEEDETLSIQL